MTKLQVQGYSQENAKQQAAQDLAQKDQSDPKVLDKLIKWVQSLGDTAVKTTLTTAVTAVVKLALKLLGVPLL